MDAAGRGRGDVDPILLRIASLLNLTTPAAPPTRAPFTHREGPGDGEGDGDGEGGAGSYAISASDVTVVSRRSRETHNAPVKAAFLPPADGAFTPATGL